MIRGILRSEVWVVRKSLSWRGWMTLVWLALLQTLSILHPPRTADYICEHEAWPWALSLIQLAEPRLLLGLLSSK